MTAVLMHRRIERRLAGPTEAISAGPESLQAVLPGDNNPELATEGVTAIVDQAMSLVERNPESPAALARLSQAQLATRRLRDARRTARRVLSNEAAPSDPPSLVAAAIVLAATGNREEAESAFASLKEGQFAHLFAQLAVERGDLGTALSRLKSATDSVSCGLRGWIEVQQHKYRESVQSFREVVKAGSASPEIFINLGYAYGALGSTRKAIRATQTALGMAPASRTAAFNLAAFYGAAGDRDSALRALEHARRFHPNELAPRLAIASVYARFSDLSGAERELRNAQQDRPRWSTNPKDNSLLSANLIAIRQAQGTITAEEAYRSVRDILHRSNYENLGIARLLPHWMNSTRLANDSENLLRALEQHHSASKLGAFRTRCAYLRLDFERAITEARCWMTDEPFDAGAVMMLTFLLSEVGGAIPEAERIGQIGLRRMPSEIVIRNNLAFALAMEGKLNEARSVLGVLFDGEEPYCLATAGLIRMRSGQIAEGLTTYNRAIDLAEESGQADIADLVRQRLAIESSVIGQSSNYDAVAILSKHISDPRFVINDLGAKARSAH
jgi:tetratricopeptide (TPR) repeat protein